MDFDLNQPLLQAYKKAGGANPTLLNLVRKEDRDYGYYRSSSLMSEHVEDADLELLVKVAAADAQYLLQATARRNLRKMRAILKMRKDGGKRITNLEVMIEALREYLMSLAHHWVFIEDDAGQQVPWFIEKIRYNPEQRDRGGSYHPAYNAIDLKGKLRGKEETKTITFYRGELSGGVSPAKLCDRLGIMPENEDLVARYEEELELYEAYRAQTSEQFLATGKGQVSDSDDEDEDNDRSWYRSWNTKTISFEKSGGASKVIMDDGIGYGSKGKGNTVYADTSFWIRTKTAEEREQLEEDGKPVFAPVHPYVCVFHLPTHDFAIAHISSLTPYEYDDTLMNKLVLPKDHKRLIDVLIRTTHRDAEDIVRGKRGGVVILCSGAPGTGKTLTAEVYSEFAKRPLYTVQCSQLGTDAESLEKQLAQVLQRATRWRACLLLDEADVYIHERGSDVNQNAIVGVFLRLLEYYSGIMFLTTNRATVVDDAIHSRCIAHIKYVVPGPEDRATIWRILSKQYKVKLDDALIELLVDTFPEISGRSIKQLCRLVQTMEAEPSLNLLKWLATYQDGVKAVTTRVKLEG